LRGQLQEGDAGAVREHFEQPGRQLIPEADVDLEARQSWSFVVSSANFVHVMSTIFAKPQLRIQLPHALPIDLEAVLRAVEHASNEQAVMDIVKAFLDVVETSFPVDSDPIAVVTTIFGIEGAAAVAEVGAAAVVALEAEEAATGGAISERAERRIARDMVRHMTRRARCTMPHLLRPRSAQGVRIRRAPRTRRAHRRAVRLSAVASAGDGPPPREPPAATRAPDGVPVALAGGRVPSAGVP
jgi:hypothetical protein